MTIILIIMGILFVISFPRLSIAILLVWLIGTIFRIAFNSSKKFYRNLLISSTIMTAIIEVLSDKHIVFIWIDNIVKFIADKTYLTKYYGNNVQGTISIFNFDYNFILGILLTLAEIGLLYLISKFNINIKNVLFTKGKKKMDTLSTSKDSIDKIKLGTFTKKS